MDPITLALAKNYADGVVDPATAVLNASVIGYETGIGAGAITELESGQAVTAVRGDWVRTTTGLRISTTVDRSILRVAGFGGGHGVSGQTTILRETNAGGFAFRIVDADNYLWARITSTALEVGHTVAGSHTVVGTTAIYDARGGKFLLRATCRSRGAWGNAGIRLSAQIEDATVAGDITDSAVYDVFPHTTDSGLLLAHTNDRLLNTTLYDDVRL